MAIQTINFTDKVALNDDPSVADINKCKASDLNEIKSVVNNNANEIPTKTSDLTNDSNFVTNTTEAGTFAITKTSGNGNIIAGSLQWKRFGKIVQIFFQFNTSGGATAVGSNIFVGTVSNDLPLPSNDEAIGFGYYGSTLNACIIQKTKNITIRCLAAQAVQTTDAHGMTIMYICD